MDEPYLFGRIAALHSLSDLFAMNAAPTPPWPRFACRATIPVCKAAICTA